MKLLQEQHTETSKDKIGYVFDVKRFAVHDGSGIRTTVFLKGCPLRCKWCQNPEGLKATKQIIYMQNKCIKCKSCMRNSQNHGVSLAKDKIIVNRKVKDDWDRITDSCPTMALCYDSKSYTLAELVDEIKKDKVFFNRGGGITFSGGEPFLQHEFLLDCLKLCKKLGIHTAIETSLYVDTKILEKTLPYVDEIFADMKVFDRTLHYKYTNVYNDVIKTNIAYLLAGNRKDDVIIRTPLIPQMTATAENISQIAKFISSYHSGVKYELLNYNPLAKAKYNYLDIEYCFEDNPKLYMKDEMKYFYDIAIKNGVENLIRE